MNFKELHTTIPYVIMGKAKSLTMEPYPNVILAMPGRHAKDTTPKGGDFVVMVTDNSFLRPRHQFTHTDIFLDVERKRNESTTGLAYALMNSYLNVVLGADPLKEDVGNSAPGVEPLTMLCALQCLAVAEHRRYAHYELRFGGRFLPFRFAAGVAEGLWSAAQASDRQKRGRPGVEWLERDHGTPVLTKLLKATG